MNKVLRKIFEIRSTVALTVLALALFWIEPIASDWISGLEYDLAGPVWTQIPNLFTCHWLHWSGEHLFWDVGMFALLCGFCERIHRGGLWATLMIAAVLSPPCVGIVHPDVATYRGLSGLDTALFAMAVVCLGAERFRDSDFTGLLMYCGLMAGMIAKTAHEWIWGTVFVESTNFTPVPIAHLVGATVGMAVGWAVSNRKWPRLRCDFCSAEI